MTTITSSIAELDCRELYRKMVLVRRFDELVLELRTKGAIDGVVHPYIGQEAVAVGACANLTDRDRITSTHRGHGHCIAKGADTNRMMAELYGREDGYCRGKGGSMHIADFEIGMLGANGIVAAGLPIAAGAALAASIAGDGAVSVCFFSDGASGAGPFHENLNISVVWQLPVIWMCENNGWATATPIEQSLAVEGPATLAASYGLPCEAIDGNDVLAVYDACNRAVAHARAGGGPSFIEARTFRRSAHAIRSVLPREQRNPELIALWESRDPINRFETRLLDEGVLESTALAEVRDEVEQQLQDALDYARRSPVPRLGDALAEMFSQ